MKFSDHHCSHSGFLTPRTSPVISEPCPSLMSSSLAVSWHSSSSTVSPSQPLAIDSGRTPGEDKQTGSWPAECVSAPQPFQLELAAPGLGHATDMGQATRTTVMSWLVKLPSASSRLPLASRREKNVRLEQQRRAEIHRGIEPCRARLDNCLGVQQARVDDWDERCQQNALKRDALVIGIASVKAHSLTLSADHNSNELKGSSPALIEPPLRCQQLHSRIPRPASPAITTVDSVHAGTASPSSGRVHLRLHHTAFPLRSASLYSAKNQLSASNHLSPGTETPPVRTIDPAQSSRDEKAYAKYLACVTGLSNQAFYKTDASHARISHQRQAYYLSAALSLAQQSLFDVASRCMPATQNKTWPEGTCMVKFGTDEISDGVLGEGLPDVQSHAINVLDARDAIARMPSLRNAACHPGDDFEFQLKSIDDKLERGHRVAVELHDFKHAMEFRKLRDQLKEEGKESWQEVVSPVEVQTKGTIWSKHHERLFFQTLENLFGRPAELRAAANIWNQGGHPLSKGYPEESRRRGHRGYRRVPGQDDDYFARINQPHWQSDAAEFRNFIAKMGAPPEVQAMSARGMMDVVNANTPRWNTGPEAVKKAEAHQDEKTKLAVGDAVESGLFNYR